MTRSAPQIPPTPQREPVEAAVRLLDVSVAVPGPSSDRHDVSLLEGITADLTQRRVAVIGLNGSGKSTLLRVLNGLVPLSAGSARVHGIDVGEDVRAARRAVGFLFSDPAAQLLMPTPQEDVELSLRAEHPAAQERTVLARALLEEAGLGQRRRHSIHDLSGGERQLVALTAVLAVSPSVLALDEPTTLLDLRHRDRLLQHLEALPQQQIIATHDLDLAATAERVLLIHRGRLLADGAAGEVIGTYRRWCREGFPGEAGCPGQGHPQ